MPKRSPPALNGLLTDGIKSLPHTSPEAVRTRHAVLEQVAARTFRAPHLLTRYHDFLCFLRAYPDDRAIHEAACEELRDFGARIRSAGTAMIDALAGSGIAGTTVRVEFPLESAGALARAFPGEIAIEWDAFEDESRLELLLHTLIGRAELQSFDDGTSTTREWVARAVGRFAGTDFDWLIAQVKALGIGSAALTQLYDHATPPLAWNLDGSAGSITALTLDAIRPQPLSLRTPPTRAAEPFDPNSLKHPPEAVTRVTPRLGRRLIDAAVATLAARGRDVYAFNYGNPDEVYAIDVGRAVTVVIAGVLPEWRLALEANYGYVAFKNGVPVSYGGMTALFHQANTGVNVFEPFRHAGEAKFLFTSVLRACCALFDSTRFVVNGYQIGEGNSEAVDSGAYWFYHKLGFRPDTEERRRLSAAEVAKKARTRGHRTDRATLRKLAAGDVHLRLAGDSEDDFFPERWLERVALGVTDRIGEARTGDRQRVIKRLIGTVARQLGATPRGAWPRPERVAFENLAPIVALLDGSTWTATERRGLTRMLRKKGTRRERDWVEASTAHPTFHRDLAAWCRATERKSGPIGGRAGKWGLTPFPRSGR